MNANIFSCTVPPLLVLETQIIHPELLQSLCTTHWDPFFWQTYVRGWKRLRARADICARPYPCAPTRTRLRASSPIYARPLASARALRQRGFRFDTSASLKLPTVKKKMVKIFLHADVCLKRMDGQVCPSVRVLNRRPNLHVRLVRQPCSRMQTLFLLCNIHRKLKA